jgi:hypothetical protein
MCIICCLVQTRPFITELWPLINYVVCIAISLQLLYRFQQDFMGITNTKRHFTSHCHVQILLHNTKLWLCYCPEYLLCTKNTTVYHTHLPILRLRKNGIARLCMYFDVMSLALYKHSVKTRWMLALYYRRVNENDSYLTLNGLYFGYVINRIFNLCKFITEFIALVE